MIDDLPLFSADPEPEGPYQVKGLGEHGMSLRGDWHAFWAIAPRPLYHLQDRGAVMKLQGFDPEAFRIHDAAPIIELGAGVCTWWQAWPLHLPAPTV